MLRNYDRSWLRLDIAAGVSVAAVALPVGIAYADLAGLSPVTGLYASILPLIAYALFGSSRQLIVGPDSATCVIVAATLTPLAVAGTARYDSLSMTLAVLVGMICIIGGIAKLGFIANFLAKPILTGFLNGIALSIISGQLGRLFGFSVHAKGFFRLLYEFFAKIGQTQLPTLVLGLAIFAMLIILKRQAPKLPAPLIAVVVGIIAVIVFGLQKYGVAVVGTVPAGLPPIRIPSATLDDLTMLIFGAAGIALVSFNSGMLTSSSFASKNHYEVDANQDFFALGVSDIASGLSGGFAISGADSRTAINDSVGGKSQLTSVVAAITIAIVLLFATGPLAYLPTTVLAAVLISAAIGLFDLPALVWYYQQSQPEFRISVIATLGVITLGVLPGILIAVGLAILKLLSIASHPHDVILGRTHDTDTFCNLSEQTDCQAIPGLIIYRFDSALVFFNSGYFKKRVRQIIAEAQSKVEWFILDAETINLIDLTACDALGDIRGDLTDKGIILVLVRTHSKVRNALDKSGVSEQIGYDRFFPTLQSAVEAFRKR